MKAIKHIESNELYHKVFAFTVPHVNESCEVLGVLERGGSDNKVLISSNVIPNDVIGISTHGAVKFFLCPADHLPKTNVHLYVSRASRTSLSLNKVANT